MRLNVLLVNMSLGAVRWEWGKLYVSTNTKYSRLLLLSTVQDKQMPKCSLVCCADMAEGQCSDPATTPGPIRIYCQPLSAADSFTRGHLAKERRKPGRHFAHGITSGGPGRRSMRASLTSADCRTRLAAHRRTCDDIRPASGVGPVVFEVYPLSKQGCSRPRSCYLPDLVISGVTV